MRQVLRWTIPLDDKWHRVEAGVGSLIHVATRAEDLVEVWALVDEDARGACLVQVFATGTPVEGTYIGTAVTPHYEHIWHLFAKEA